MAIVGIRKTTNNNIVFFIVFINGKVIYLNKFTKKYRTEITFSILKFLKSNYFGHFKNYYLNL
jgi:hypothetical protein